MSRYDWFITYSGIQVSITDPTIDMISIVDIAHALSHQCRYAGHVREFYSVAQHSVLVSWNVPSEFAKEGLLHDAAEAYVQDIIRPIKHMDGMQSYRELEEKFDRLIAEKFGLQYPWHSCVKEADNRAVLTERRDLYEPSVIIKYPDILTGTPFKDKIVAWPSFQAHDNFMNRFNRLFNSKA